MQIRFHCPHCDLPMRLSHWESLKVLLCPRCEKNIHTHIGDTEQTGHLSHCVVCGCKDLFRQKLFNRNLGIGIVVLGIIASFFVLPPVLPLLVVGLIDVLLYLFLPEMAVCYRCDAEHRGFAIPKDLKLYDHLKAAKAKKEPTYPGAV